MRRILIGITGSFGSGKSTAASFFSEKGFVVITLSSFLEEEARKRGNEQITRKALQDIGNEWREKYGASYLAKTAKEYIEKNNIEKAVVDGIRNIGEIEYLRKEKQFLLLAVITNRKIRYNRLRRLKRREKLTPTVFKKLDYRDLGVGEATSGQQVAFCITLADVFIGNNRDKNSFRRSLGTFLKKQNTYYGTK